MVVCLHQTVKSQFRSMSVQNVIATCFVRSKWPLTDTGWSYHTWLIRNILEESQEKPFLTNKSKFQAEVLILQEKVTTRDTKQTRWPHKTGKDLERYFCPDSEQWTLVYVFMSNNINFLQLNSSKCRNVHRGWNFHHVKGCFRRHCPIVNQFFVFQQRQLARKLV